MARIEFPELPDFSKFPKVEEPEGRVPDLIPDNRMKTDQQLEEGVGRFIVYTDKTDSCWTDYSVGHPDFPEYDSKPEK